MQYFTWSFLALGGPPTCLIHFEGKSGELNKLAMCTPIKIKEYCNKLVKLGGGQKEIPGRIVTVVREWPDIEPEVMPTGTDEIHYHIDCYIQFCNKSKVVRPEAWISKAKNKLLDRQKETKQSPNWTRRPFKTTDAFFGSNCFNGFWRHFWRKMHSSCHARKKKQERDKRPWNNLAWIFGKKKPKNFFQMLRKSTFYQTFSW